ncbi:MAG: response regulator [Gemmatimonadales bacterium]
MTDRTSDVELKPSGTSSRVRLLMVEDSEDDAFLIRRELAKAGYELDWKRVDREQDFVDALGSDWDLIISDFHMPEFDGLRAFAVYRELGVDIPFIFVSGALGEDRAVEAMRAGARDYLLKGNLARLNVAVKRELAASRNRAAKREAEDAARREQWRLAMAVEASGAGVFEHSVPPGPDTYHSPRWAEILGYTAADLPSFEDFDAWFVAQLEPDDAAVVLPAYEDFIDGRAKSFDMEMRLRHRDGRWIDVRIDARAVERTSTGSASHVVGVMLDLSERRSLEAQLRQAQKMEAIGRLAGGIAHDFNNLLTVIYTSGEFVLQTLEPETPAREDMVEVLNAAKKAGALTGQLLAFSRNKPISPRVMNLNSVMADMGRMLQRVVGTDIEISTTLAPDLWNVRADPGSIEQVITNLAVNARDAMPDGGELTIETENTELDDVYGTVHGAHIPAGEYVVIAVSDEGIGMDQETQRRIFEPFFTTKGVGKGTGLGLSTCYGIVKQAGGHIWVYSEVGRGTTFKVYLPRAAEAATDTPRESREREDLTGTETILLAEDDDRVRQVVVRVLTGLGYRVIATPNGAAALAECRETDIEFDLLLADIVMPEIGGIQLAREAVVLRPGLKVLYMSGYTPNAMVRRGELEPGANMLQKPFTAELLGRTVREVLDD